MKLSDEELAGYRAMADEVCKLKRLLDINMYKIETYLTELMVKHNLPPGQRFDVNGDGIAKPAAECGKLKEF